LKKATERELPPKQKKTTAGFLSEAMGERRASLGENQNNNNNNNNSQWA
jgi:hypothetical protein